MSRPFLAGHWSRLLFVHYEVEPERLLPRLPAGTELDLHRGRAFVSLVCVRFARTRLLGLPLAGLGDYPEINLRFYARAAPLPGHETAGERHGVVFVREFVPSKVLAWAARAFFQEPFLPGSLECTERDDAQRLELEYTLGFRGREFRVRAVGLRPGVIPPAGSLEHFLKERYWGFSRDDRGRTRVFRVEHPEWEILAAESAELDWDWGAIYGDDWAFLQDQEPYSVFLSPGSEAEVHRAGLLG